MFNARETIAEQLKNNTLALGAGLINQTEWDVRTENALLHFESTVHSSGVTSTSKRKWTFFGAALFCVTTYTTIGQLTVTAGHWLHGQLPLSACTTMGQLTDTAGHLAGQLPLSACTAMGQLTVTAGHWMVSCRSMVVPL